MYLFSLGASVTLLIPTVLISIVLILFSPQHPYRVVVVAGEWMRGWMSGIGGSVVGYVGGLVVGGG